MKHSVRRLGISSVDRVFMQVANFTFRVRQGEFGEATDPDYRPFTEAGDMGIRPIWLGFTKRKGRFYIELTGMTLEELELFERGMALGIEAAREVVKYLDEHAESEYNDDTPMIPLRALRSAPPAVLRRIRPFIGTEMDPCETKADEKQYNDDVVESPLTNIV